MKFILLLFSTGVLSIGCYSQQSEIADWQKKHPHVLFVEQGDYTPEFKAQLDAFNREVIVYDNEITMDVIEAYASQTYEKTTLYSTERINEAYEIKVWLSQHPDLKIVPRSLFSEQSEKDRDFLIDSGVMVLNGEKITLQDIENYEATH